MLKKGEGTKRKKIIRKRFGTRLTLSRTLSNQAENSTMPESPVPVLMGGSRRKKAV